MSTNMKTITFLALIMLACFTNKAHAETICMHECPSLCMKQNTEAEEIECYFFCVLNCEQCPDSPTGCPPDEETKKKIAEANLNGMQQIFSKKGQQGTGTGAGKGTDAGTGAGTGIGTDTGADTDAGTGTGTGADTDAGTGTGTGAGTGTGTGAGTGTTRKLKN